ncbi:hypothetical protein DL771_008038 [Monosporascus sp. 5C6A]|nr:hypothetical protein DL771_008038 [Monosporascus sp. 5C6A]
MWDQYDIGFGYNRVSPSASLQVSVPISIPISVQDSVPVNVFFSFPAKDPVKVKVKVPANFPVKAVKQARRYPQSESAAKKHFEKKGASFLQKAYKAYEKAQNVADMVSLVTDIFDRVEEGKRAKNEIERPEFKDTDAARGVHPQDVLRQAATDAVGLVPTAVTGKTLDTILENFRQVEAQNVELQDRLTALENQQEENLQTTDSIEEEVEDVQERLRELERQDGRTPGHTRKWPGLYAKCWKRIHKEPWECVEGVCYLICSLCHTAMPKRGHSGKAPVCRTCKTKAARTRKSTEASFKKLANEAKARSNGALRPTGEIPTVRKRGAEELEDEPDVPGQDPSSSTGSWRSPNSGTEQEEQSTRRKRRRVSDTDVNEPDSDSIYRGRRPTRTQESSKKRRQVKETNEPSSKPTRRSSRVAARRSSP